MIRKMVPLTLILFAAGLLMTQTVSASLTANNGMVYDDVSGLYWYQNLNDFSQMTYSQKISEISGLTTGGFSWHLATEDEMDSLIDNVGVQYPYGSTPYPEASQITDAFIHTRFASGYYFYMGIYESIGGTGTHNIMEIQKLPANSDNFYFITGINLSQWTAPDGNSTSDIGAWVVADAAPVPVPATMTLFGIGLLGLVGVNRRKY